MSRAGDAIRETWSSLSTVFRNRNLRLLQLGFAGSIIGDWAMATAITVWAYGVGGVVLVGLWVTIRYAIWAIILPFASVLVDRLPRKAVMISSDLSRTVVILVVAWLIAVDGPVWLIIVLSTLNSLLGAPFNPASAALLPSIVTTPEELTASNGVRSTFESVGFFVGPALGGLLLTVTSIPVVAVFDAITFVWSAAMVFGIHVPEKAVVESEAPERLASEAAAGAEGTGTTLTDVAEDSDEVKEGFWAELSAGFRYIFSNADLRLISLIYCAQCVIAGASAVFGVEIAAQMTNFGPAGIGYIDSAFGLGAIVGGVVAIGRARLGRLATDFGAGVMLWGVPLLIVAIVPFTLPALLAMAVVGFGNPLADVNANTILQRLTPDRVLGRVFGALDSGLIVGMGLGSFFMPFVINAVGLRWSLVLIAVAICVVTLPAWRRFQRMDAQLGFSEELEILRGLPLFSPLEPKSLEAIAHQLGRREAKKGEVIITEGDIGDRFYIVESGRTTATHDGAVLSSQGPGDPFGEIALLRDVPRTATVTADEPSVLLYLERDEFLAAVTGNSEVSSRANDLISRRTPTY
jgi:MFS family permease